MAALEDGQRRFRRRGGAKKKKKHAADDKLEHPSPPASTPAFVSGFPSSAAPSTLDADISSYLSHLVTSLDELDPTGSIAVSYAASPLADDPPPSVLLSRNALLELAPRIPELARDAFASNLLESLLRACAAPGPPAAVLCAALAPGPSRFTALAGHHAASHVLGAALTALAGSRAAPEASDAFAKLADVMRNAAANDLAELVHSPGGSHVFRDIVAVLAGIPSDEPREAKLDDSEPDRIRSYVHRLAVDVPGEFHAAVCAVAHTLLDADTLKLHDWLWTPAPCAALQGLLAAISVSDKELAGRLALECMAGEEASLMRNACGSRFVERTVLCLGSSAVRAAYQGQLRELAKDAKANFVVQRILLSLRGRGEVMGAWDELEEAVPELLRFGKAREGVVLSLLRVTEAEGDENCRRRASRCVMRACGAVGERSKLLVGVLMMGSEEMWARWRAGVKEMGRTGMGLSGNGWDELRVPRSLPSPGLLGTLITRCLMRFPGGPGQGVRDSMGTLSADEVVALVGNAVGSRAVEQWVEGETGTGSKKVVGKVVKAVCGENERMGLLGVVRNPYGAQVVVRCAGMGGGATRKTIMEVLASDFEGLKKSDCGQMVLRKCRVEHYMRRGDEWENEETTRETRERLFADILGDDGEGEGAKVGKKEKKKKRRTEGEEGEEGPVKSKKRKRLEESDKEGVEEKADGMLDSLFTESKEGEGENTVPKRKDVVKLEEENRTGLDKVLGAITETAGSHKKEKKGKGKGKKKKRKQESE